MFNYILLLSFILTHWYNNHYHWWQKWLPSHKRGVCVSLFCFNYYHIFYSFNILKPSVIFVFRHKQCQLQPESDPLSWLMYLFLRTPCDFSGTARSPRFTLHPRCLELARIWTAGLPVCSSYKAVSVNDASKFICLFSDTKNFFAQ